MQFLTLNVLFLLLNWLIINGGQVSAERSREAIFDMGNGRVVLVDKFLLTCPEDDKVHYPLYYDNLTVTGAGGKISIGYDLVYEIDIDDPFTLHIDIQRCKSKENPDSCIKFAAFKTARLCSLLNDHKQFWSAMVTCATPSLKCPTAKGVYRGRDCKVDMTHFNWFPIGDSYWKLKVQFEYKNKMVGCGLNEGKMATMKQ